VQIGCRESPRETDDAETSARSADSGAANVVIFLIDTLRADRLGAYGYGRPTSPTIDALAAEGVVFEQAHAPAPWTLPSVASIMLSRFPCEHGVLIDGDRISENAQPLAARLKKAAYATASFYANPYAGPMSGLDAGFDVCRSTAMNPATEVDRWLETLSGAPALIYVHTTEPHNPYLAQPRMIRRFGEVSGETIAEVRRLYGAFRQLTRVNYVRRKPPGTIDNTAEQERVLRSLGRLKPQIDVLYDAVVREADGAVAGVVETLKRRGLWEDTMFVLISDHGEEMGEHGGWQHDQSVYEEIVRVPFVIRFPRGQYAGRRISTPSSLIDLAPTILDYLGQSELSAGCRGRSLMPLLTGPGGEGGAEARVTALRHNKKKYYRPFKEGRGDLNVVVRRGKWKAIWNDDVQRLELFDLAGDSAERQDLSARESELAGALGDFAKSYLEECKVAESGAGAELPTAEDLERLKSLGYIGDDSEMDDDEE